LLNPPEAATNPLLPPAAVELIDLAGLAELARDKINGLTGLFEWRRARIRTRGTQGTPADARAISSRRDRLHHQIEGQTSSRSRTRFARPIGAAHRDRETAVKGAVHAANYALVQNGLGGPETRR